MNQHVFFFISAAAVYLLFFCLVKLKYVAMLCTQHVQAAPKCSCTDAQTYKSNEQACLLQNSSFKYRFFTYVHTYPNMETVILVF